MSTVVCGGLCGPARDQSRDIFVLFTEVEVNSTLVITLELTNQNAQKALFSTCVVYSYFN